MTEIHIPSRYNVSITPQIEWQEARIAAGMSIETWEALPGDPWYADNTAVTFRCKADVVAWYRQTTMKAAVIAYRDSLPKRKGRS